MHRHRWKPDLCTLFPIKGRSISLMIPLFLLGNHSHSIVSYLVPTSLVPRHMELSRAQCVTLRTARAWKGCM